MDFRIADTFTDSLAKLTSEEQKAVKTTAFDLQLNPANPGMQFHKLDRAKDPNFWSVRVNKDIRVIVHRTHSSVMLCYVDHHDAAYTWAERRKIERHPMTGAAQLVEIRESVREIVIPRYIEQVPDASPAKLLFADTPEWVLMTYGVPPEWINDVRGATEETLFDVVEHLPREAAEALLDLAVGIRPPIGPGIPPHADAFSHPDAEARFRVINNVEELERALDAPWERWVVFLHPAQRDLVERDYSGPARVFGSAGTGKTIVALHRAVHLTRKNADSRVLLTTFSETLANALRSRLRLLLGNEPRLGERIEVHSVDAIGRRLSTAHGVSPNVASDSEVRKILHEAAALGETPKVSEHFLWTEWSSVVDPWQLSTWEQYRDVKRLGRKTRLPEKQRSALWSVFDRARTLLRERQLLTKPQMFTELAARLRSVDRPIFDCVIVDEAQDVSIPEMRFFRALGGARQNALFFAGDLGQRIFQTPFSWKEVGVDVRGRATRLRVNYRTSHQIRTQADRLLGPELSDVDGITEERKGTVSAFNGVPPQIAIEESEEAEIDRVSQWINARVADGLKPHEIAMFVRSADQLARARMAAERAGVPAVLLDERVETQHGRLPIMTMHLAKGLEFRAVAVMACDEDVLPLQSRIASAADESDLEEIYQSERHLLYVGCTRARDYLHVSGVAPASEFIGDFRI
jgi:mRNA-degrading endonuclease RelE of RelBE toxin-antitoxin system